MKEVKMRATGRNIYIDGRGRDIYYDRFTKCGYIIQEKNLKQYNLYKNRFVLVLIGIVLSVNFLATLPTCILVGVGVLVFEEAFFRIKFLPNLTRIENFKPEKREPLYVQIANGEEKSKIILKVVLYLLLGVLIVVNSILSKHELSLLVLSVVISVFAFYFAIMNILALTKVKK